MPKVLILTLHRPQRSPSQRFRFEQYLDYLEANGFEFEWSYLLDAAADKAFYASGNLTAKFSILLRSLLKRTLEVIRPARYDMVFVQRECFMLGTAFFEKAFARKVPLIIDFDDAIWLPNVSKANKKFAFLKNPKKTESIIRCASLVFAGNEFLANYASQFNEKVMVIPTTIDTERHHNQIRQHQQREKITIGWTGTSTTLKYLKLIEPVLKKLSRVHNVELAVICDRAPELDLDNVRFIPWQLDSEIEDLLQFDIGIMPLTDNRWSKGKCGFKLLQYMALGIPTVASPVGVNKDIVRFGINGYLANTEADWLQHLSALISSVEKRKAMGTAGRQFIEQHYSVKSQQEKYLMAFRQLLAKKTAPAKWVPTEIIP